MDSSSLEKSVPYLEKCKRQRGCTIHMKECYACYTPCKTYGRYKEPKIMRVHIAGKEIFLCPSCRAIWGDLRYGFVKNHSKTTMNEISKLFESFCRSRKEKVQFT
jgi:hypothetical protein